MNILRIIFRVILIILVFWVGISFTFAPFVGWMQHGCFMEPGYISLIDIMSFIIYVLFMIAGISILRFGIRNIRQKPTKDENKKNIINKDINIEKYKNTFISDDSIKCGYCANIMTKQDEFCQKCNKKNEYHEW